MFLVTVLRHALFVLVPLSTLLTTYLYVYPVFHLCAFPSPTGNSRTSYLNTFRAHASNAFEDASQAAPFRLLALGDPQLEGDSSIPDPEAASFPNLSRFWQDALLLNGTQHRFLQRIRHSLHDLVDFFFDDIPKTLEGQRKRLDLLGNDYYLAHIYRTLQWWTKPTHVSVLGDLLGSQWVTDEEFERRSWRFWNHVFKKGQRVADDVSDLHAGGNDDDSLLGTNSDAWTSRIINVAGNHDIGYAGDLDQHRLERFERAFGLANYELRFKILENETSRDTQYSKTSSPDEGSSISDLPTPELRVVVLNDMNLDTPASSQELQDATYTFLNKMIITSYPVTRPAMFTLLLTHIPLHKEAGICVDAPFFDYHNEDFSGGIKEQNHLSADSSRGILQGLYGLSGDPGADGAGMGRRGLILTGHDHEGCDVYHYINQSTPNDDGGREWQVATWQNATSAGNLVDQFGIPGLREITVRSMMGDFGGNAGLLSLWFDRDEWEWKFEFDTCAFGPAWIWWAVHVADLITLGVGLVFAILSGLHSVGVFVPVIGSAGKVSKVIGNSQNGSVTSGKLSSLAGNGQSPANGPVTPTGKRSLRKKRSKRSLNGTPEPERRPLSSVFEIVDSPITHK